MSRDPDDRWFTCGRAACWLPRWLATSVIVSAAVAAGQVDPASAGYGMFLAGLATVTLVLGGWLVLSGRETALRVRVVPGGVELALGRNRRRLDFDGIEALEYQPPFAAALGWVPALALVDVEGARVRVPSLMTDGDRLVRALVVASEDSRLESWDQVLELSQRMGHWRRRIAIGYAAGAVPLALAAFYGAGAGA